jgi:hypothetical protein
MQCKIAERHQLLGVDAIGRWYADFTPTSDADR